jgi:hypothetical protein
VVALAIVALVIAAALRLFTTGVAAGATAARQVELAVKAQALLARVGADLELPLEEVTGEEGHLRWRLKAVPYGSAAAPTGGQGGRKEKTSLIVLQATVEGRGGERFVLSTLRQVRQP